MRCLQISAISSPLGPNICYSSLSSDTHSLCSFLRVRAQLSCILNVVTDRVGFQLHVWMSRVQIWLLCQVLRAFSLIPPGNAEIIPQIRAQMLPPTSYPIRHSVNILPFEAILSSKQRQ